MAECEGFDPSCWVANTGSEAVGGVMEQLTQDIHNTIEQSIKMLSTFWVDIPAGAISAQSGVTAFLSGSLTYYIAAAAFVSLVVGAAKIALMQNAEPVKEVGGGITRLVIVAAVGVPLISMMAILTDSIASGLIDASVTEGDFGSNLLSIMTIGGGGNPVVGFFASILMGVFAVPTALFQAILMIIRAVMLPMLAGTLVLSAAFWSFELGRQWFQRSIVWLIAFLVYKPAAAIIYSSGFILLGQGSIAGSESMGEFALALFNFICGMGLMVLAILSLGALINFVVPVAGKLTGGGGSGMMFAASAAGIVAAGAINNGSPAHAAPAGAMNYTSQGGGGFGGGPGGPEGARGTGSTGGPGTPGGSGGVGPAGANGADGIGRAGAGGGAGAAGAAGAAGGAASAGVQFAGEAAKSVKHAADGAVGSGEDQK